MNYIKLLNEVKTLTQYNDHTFARIALVQAMEQVAKSDREIKALALLDKAYGQVAKQQAWDGFINEKSIIIRNQADKALKKVLEVVLPIQSKALWGAL